MYLMLSESQTFIYFSAILNLFLIIALCSFTTEKIISACSSGVFRIMTMVIRDHIPNNLCADIDLSCINTQKIFKWLKNSWISDNEMLKTFNCGVGFCLITDKKRAKKLKLYFNKRYRPYEIGFISKSSKKINLIKKLKW